MARRQLLRDILILLVLSYAAFWWNLGKLGLIDPDEPFYALSSREMVQSGDWLTPQIFGAPQFEKPIFYYWLVAGTFRTLGESEFTGRLPTAVAATLLVLLTYAFARHLFSPRAALFAGIFMTTGLEVCLMGRLMLTDVPLAVLITGALYCYWRADAAPEHQNKWIFLHLVCTGFAVLTKGPIGSLVPLLGILSFCRITQRPCRLRGRGFWLGLAAHALIVIPWYGLMFDLHGWRFVEEFFYRDNWLRLIRAEHPANNHFWYYPGLLLLGSIPWLPALLIAVIRFAKKWRSTPVAFTGCWFISNLVFLTVAQSKLPSYAFFLFVPLALAVGTSTDEVLAGDFQTKWERNTVIGAAAFQAMVLAAVPFVPAIHRFAGPIWIFAIILALALAALCFKRYRLWLGMTSISSGIFILCALTMTFTPLEEMVSCRPVALKMIAEQKSSEPLLAGKFTVRGIAYYTRQPIAVLANKTHPFWADHPLKVIVGKKGLAKFLETSSSTLCALRRGDWKPLCTSPNFAEDSPGEWFGDNLLIRAKAQSKSMEGNPPKMTEL